MQSACTATPSPLLSTGPHVLGAVAERILGTPPRTPGRRQSECSVRPWNRRANTRRMLCRCSAHRGECLAKIDPDAHPKDRRLSLRRGWSSPTVSHRRGPADARDCYCAPHSEDAEELQCKAGGAPMGLPGSCFAYRGYADLVFLCTIPLESGGFVTEKAEQCGESCWYLRRGCVE